MPEDRREFAADPQVIGAVRYILARARIVLAAIGVAAGAALAISLILPDKFTAVCRILIEPPGGSDIRVTTAVSPVYLESLRTYELFASSDDLFLTAANRFGLRGGSQAIDALKKAVLKVEIPHNTKILEIRVTLRDPRKAHEMALFLARQTVALSRSAAMGGAGERIAAVEREAGEARVRFETAEREWATATASGPIDPLTAELEADLELRSRLLRQSVAEGRAAENARNHAAALDKKIAAEQRLLGERSARLAVLDGARRSAEADYQALRRRVQELRSVAGLGSERLEVIDPGVVPERPSSPKVLLNVLVAAALAALLAVLWLLLAFSWREPAPKPDGYDLRLAAHRD
jgi:uncharacterized protein involved in exopolysaccharide biosynthesis